MSKECSLWRSWDCGGRRGGVCGLWGFVSTTFIACGENVDKHWNLEPMMFDIAHYRTKLN
jgi:hypothetical protein